jgi:crossover junction endodeoxyribonuclease RuvC
MIILGIDPGTAIVGYGVILKEKSKLSLLDYGCVLTDKRLLQAERLYIIKKEIEKIIKKYKPQVMAVEELFFFKNLKTAITVAEARGVLLVTGKIADLHICEFTPLEVKVATVGYGRAEKQQVQKMVKAILNLKEIPKPDDAADALAIAICAANSLDFNNIK